MNSVPESIKDMYMTEGTDASVERPASASGPADMEGSSDKFFCCRWVRHRVPLAHREELYHILRMTGPLVRFGMFTSLLHI